MDLYCPKCGEPWENDTFHDEALERGLTEPFYLPQPLGADYRDRVKNPAYDSDKATAAYKVVVQDFQARGCVAIGGGTCSTPSTDTDRTFGLTRQEAAGALYDLLGDDMDGAAAMLEDMGF